MASSKQWFESVAEAQRRAEKRLPKSVYGALIAGAERGVTLEDNLAAYAEVGFYPRIATGLPAQRELNTTVMGQSLSMPVFISPTGVQAVHPDAEAAVARAAANAGTAMSLSSFASKPMEEIVAVNKQTFLQVYWLGSRERIAHMLERARQAEVAGIILTLDWTFAHRRDWGSPAIPERIDLKTMVRFAPEVIRRPRWLAAFARSGGPPSLTAPNLAPEGGEAPGFFAAYGEWMGTPIASWDDVAWMREQWDGRMLVKGVTRPEDASRAAEIGVDAISVSNHGGNNLDGTPASIRALPDVVAAVGDRLEIVLDGGVRRGSDVVKALALGAQAVMIGRAALWGLAANGEAGVTNVLENLRAGIDETLVGLGRGSVRELAPEDVILPTDFIRRHAAPPA